MPAQIRKFDDSAAVRVSIIGIESSTAPVFRLADLLSAATGENIHDEVDFGAPVGKELPWWPPHRI